MNPIVAVSIGFVVALVGTILAYIYIIPEKKRESLPKFFQFVADIFNFKKLLLESILKALYVFNTISVIAIGFFMLFSGTSSYSFYSHSYGFKSLAGYGLLLMIFGPIVIRLTYEALMMFVILVKNTMDINKKLNTCHKEPAVQPAETAQPVAEVYEPHYVFCTQCGTKYDEKQGGCPNQCEKNAKN